MKDRIYAGKGILDQIKKVNDYEFNWDAILPKKKSTIIIDDAGDNTLFIKRNLSQYRKIVIWSKKSKILHTSSEIVNTPVGAIIYFKESLNNEFKKGNIYPVKLYYDTKAPLYYFYESVYSRRAMSALISEYHFKPLWYEDS